MLNHKSVLITGGTGSHRWCAIVSRTLQNIKLIH
jgi:FlaA1/EpsC-like NDP-sugar epimerase